MKIKKHIIFLLLLSLVPFGAHGQSAIEYNSVNNWIYPSTQKYIGMDFVNSISGTLMNNGTIWYSHNFKNDGIVDFVNTLAANPALSLFTGTGTQHIEGTGTTRFYSLLFDNQIIAGAFRLDQSISVANQANFTKGIAVATQTTPETMMNIFKFEDGASCTNASDNSYVDGFVSKVGNTAFTYPIGNGGFYRPAAISAPNAIADCFAARYLNVNPDNAGYTRSSKVNTISNVSDKEYWLVNHTVGTANAQLTLSWDVTKTSAIVPSNLNNIKIVRWDGSKWIDEGNISTTGDATSGTITANVSGYGVFTLAMVAIRLSAVNDSVTTLEEKLLTGNVLANDSLPSSSTVTVTGFKVNGTVYQPGVTATIPNVGTIALASNGAYTFTPELNYNGVVPSITYTINDGNGNSSNANLIIKVLPLPEVTKTSTKPKFKTDGTFSWIYTIALFNDTPTPIDSIQVEDNLDNVFKNEGCTYRVTGIAASGSLTANGLYNGSSDIKTLKTGGSLKVNQRDSIQIEVNVDVHGQKALSVYNSAIFNGLISTNIGQVIAQQVVVKSDADIKTSVKDSTETAIPLIDLTIPDAFSPNNDGVNDRFEILHPTNMRIEFEVLNRWGYSVYKSNDYKNDWDGRGTGSFLGHDLPTGTYYCAYKVTDITTGKEVTKGVKAIMLRRE